MVWRDTPALRGGGFELLLDYNWIKKGALERGFGSAVWPLGCWGVVTRLQLLPMWSSACGCRKWFVLFFLPVISSPGDIKSEE